MNRFDEIVLEWIKTVPSAQNMAGLDAGSDLIGDGVLDSLAVLDLVSFLEDRFSLSLPVEEFVPENFRNVAAIADLARRLGGTAS
jgi:acyl carrier protein